MRIDKRVYMRIAFISDTHLGFGWKDKEIRSDSIRQAKEAFLRAVDEDVDLIIHPGDIFDDKNPKPEIWVEALRIFSIPKSARDSSDSRIRVLDGPARKLHMKGIPVIAIHGNHERRGANKKTSVEALDAAGLLVYLHNGRIKIEKDEERVNIFGMGYVPEGYAPKVMKLVPEKEQDSFNIFVMHQNVKEYLPGEVSFLSLSDLPRYDLVVNGHIHFNDYRDYKDWIYMMPGSTVITQMKKQEAERRKGFYIFDTELRNAKFIELETQRPFIFKTLDFSNSDPAEIIEKARSTIDEALSEDYRMKPIIKIKLTGSIKIGRNVDKASLTNGFEDRAIIVIDNQLESSEFKKRIEELREIHMMKKANINIGLALLKARLSEAGYSGPDIEDFFDSLVSGDLDSVLDTAIRHYQNTSSRDTSSQ